jgi:transcriptional regulator with XRE-family HTH domain
MDDASSVEAAMDDARIEMGLEWKDVAERASMSVQTLHRIRKGGTRTAEATRRLEQAFGWPRGYLDAIAAGEPPPATASRVGELEQLRDLAATLQDNIDALRRRLDELDSNGAHRATS